MATVIITVEADSKIPRVQKRIDEAMEKVAKATAEHIRDQARESMVGSGGGRVYTSGPPPVPHTASAPGRPPAIWTGNLFASIYVHPLGGASYIVTSEAPYSEYLEFGTSTPMAPRPFFRPAARKGQAFARTRGAGIVRAMLRV